MAPTVGLLSPGAMGAEVGRALLDAERAERVLWLPSGRSGETRRRADSAGLEPVETMAELVEQATMVLSICPPADADAVAGAVSRAGFTGIYVDANAIRPSRVSAMSEQFDRFVDGGIVGGPPTADGTTRLYLSGREAPTVGGLVRGSRLEPVFLGDEVGLASGLKMAYAAWTKGTGALLYAIHKLARELGVEDALADEWARSLPDLVGRAEQAAPRTARKAWRFAPEMEEIAATFESVGLAGSFHEGAHGVYRRLAGLRHRADVDLDTLLASLDD